MSKRRQQHKQPKTYYSQGQAVGVGKMQTLEELVNGKYDEEVTIAVLVSKFK